MGVTYKKYVGKWTALEFTVGAASPYWSRTYYQNSFNDYSRYDSYIYLSHKLESTVYFQARWLMHFNIPVQDMEGKLNWYWGLGGVVKVAKLTYRFTDPASNPSTRSEVTSDIDVGPEGILGVEYTFEDIPLAVFGDASLMLEVADRPGAARTFGALGVRYNFP